MTYLPALTVTVRRDALGRDILEIEASDDDSATPLRLTFWSQKVTVLDARPKTTAPEGNRVLHTAAEVDALKGGAVVRDCDGDTWTLDGHGRWNAPSGAYYPSPTFYVPVTVISEGN